MNIKEAVELTQKSKQMIEKQNLDNKFKAIREAARRGKTYVVIDYPFNTSEQDFNADIELYNNEGYSVAEIETMFLTNAKSELKARRIRISWGESSK